MKKMLFFLSTLLCMSTYSQINEESENQSLWISSYEDTSLLVVKDNENSILYEISGGDANTPVKFGITDYNAIINCELDSLDSFHTTYASYNLTFEERKTYNLEIFCTDLTDTVYHVLSIKVNSKPQILNDTTITINISQLEAPTLIAKDPDNDVLFYGGQVQSPSGDTIMIDDSASWEQIFQNKQIEIGLYQAELFVTDDIDTSWTTIKVLVTDATQTTPSLISTQTHSLTFNSNSLRYSISKQTKITCQIFSLNGKLIDFFSSSQKPGNYTHTPNLNPGYYITRFSFDNDIKTYSLTILK